MDPVIIIGAGQAAVSFAAAFRAIDRETPLTIVGDEPVIPYQRPPLSKKYATGDMSADQLQIRARDWYTTENVDLELGASVTDIDRKARTITLADGRALNWSKLVFATGSRVRQLPDEVTGGLENIFYVRSLADADAFGAQLDQARRVVIIGGGYIGLEAAAVCRSKGMEVTLVEASPRILGRVACAETADWFRTCHEDHGVKIIEGTGLSHFEGDGSIARAVLTDGTTIEADMAVVGIGILPNVELAEAAGLACENGLIVDAHCRSSDPDIYGAGDCAIFDYDGQPTRLESVPNAIDQATVAAKNMAGDDDQPYLAKPWFWSDQYDVKLQIAGLNRGYDSVVTRDEPRGRAHFYYREGQLIAVDAINAPRVYMIGKRLIEAGKNIAPEHASDADFDLKSLM